MKNLNTLTPKKFYLLLCLIVFLTGCSDNETYNGTIEKEKIDKFITAKLERPETYTCTTLSPGDTLTIMGKKKRMAYIEYVYKDHLDNMITKQQWVYMDTLGNVYRLDDRN